MTKADELKKLKSQRDLIKSRYTRFVAFFENPDNRSNVELIKARLRGIDSCFIDFEEVHSQIEFLDSTQVNEEELTTFESEYYRTISKVNTFIENATKPIPNIAPTSTSTSEVQTVNNDIDVKLPNIQLPCFTGIFTDWITFKDTFESLIHNNAKLSNIQKFHYLKSSIKGTALQTIEHLSLSDSNYTAAWDLLTTRFENVRLITQHHIRAIFALPSITKDAKSVRNLLLGLTSNMKALESIKRPVQHWDDFLVHLITTKFDSPTTIAWENTLTTTPPTVEELTKFLTQRCQMLESLEINNSYNKLTSPVNSNINNKFTKNTQFASSHVSINQRVNPCIMCKQLHKLYQCKIFLDLPINQRITQVKRHNLCQNCLRAGHSTENCVSGNCKTCHNKHNSLLHIDNNTLTQTENTTAHVCDNLIHNNVLLPTALIHVLDKNNKFQTCRALLDSGSQSNFITTKFCKKLGLQLQSINMSVTGISASISTIHYKTNVTIKSRVTPYSSNLNCLVLNQITSNLPFTNLYVSNTNIPQDITLADPSFHIPSDIDILLGVEIFWNLLRPTKIETSGSLVFQDTQLGFIACGKVKKDSKSKNNITCNLSTDVLNKQVAQFWELEDFDHKRSLSNDEQFCEEHFKAHTIRQPNGKFMVKLPFRRYPPDLGESKQIALKRFLSLENKFKKDKVLERDYRNFINEYESLGHLERVPALEAANLNPVESYYLCHHAVFKTSTTTHLRVVFDGSCPTSNKKSLNHNLHTGPALQQELFCMLLRFRMHRFVISADIAKMYRQILVHPEHQNYQLILWRDQPKKPIETYRLLTVTYGLAPSPYLAIKCLHEIATANADRFPETYKVILNDFYVDDLLTGADTIEKALQIRDEVTKMLLEGGFELRKFASNSTQLIPSNQTSISNHSISLDMQTHIKTLGVGWECQTDSIRYSVDSNQLTDKSSKRGVLSLISRLFDPLGLVSPITVVAKIILQQIWASKLDWDETLPTHLHANWTDFLKTFSELNQFSIPRMVRCTQSYTQVEIHGFCDSSQKSYGACVYLRTIDINDHVTSNLLCAKSKIAPLQALTIPRLELSAALLLAKLVDKIKHNLNISVDQCFYWSDSTIVLCWINMQSHSLKTFVANRVSQIQNITKAEEWRHINTKENPADILSRGTTPDHLINHKLWWHGPEFLLDKNFYGTNADTRSNAHMQLSDVPEVKSTCCILLTTNDHDNFGLLNKFSSFSKTLRVTAYVLRFVNNIQSMKIKRTGELSVNEIKEAHDIIIKLVQSHSFRNDIHHIKKHGEISKSSKLLLLNPFLDKYNLLRVGGRLENALISDDQKHPLILPKTHHITKLIVNEYHIQNLHAGCQATIAALRQKYWIISCRNVVRQIIFKCVRCFKTKPVSLNQLMGNLPEQRVTVARPFTNTALDYAGPITIKNGHGRTNKTLKAYIAIFVCFCTKAVHLELVCDCTSLTFLNTLKRFMARRGKVSLLYSDNGTNFVGANNELTKLFKSNEFQNKVINSLSNEQIKWQFIPPKAPHMNGLSEAAVKSVKTHLKKILSNTLLNYDEFYTILTMVEACLNSRPITPLSNDPSDLSALTPGHFLIGDAMTSPSQPDLVNVPINRLTRYQLLEKIRQHFWTRWSREYLHNLQQRGKWSKMTQPPPVGALVLLQEDNLPPQQWVLGRIQECHPGRDGLTRVVTIKTVRGVVKRAINKVCPLPNE